MDCEELTGAILGAAIAVHRELGPGFVESAYENAFVIELGHRQIEYERQRVVPVLYRGEEVATHRLDLLVAREIVVELKAIREIADVHFVVLRSYLRAVDRKHGLILNFAKPTLEIRRVTARDRPSAPSWVPA
jgi:GxxExxY protein